jgi:hypothetical protein
VLLLFLGVAVEVNAGLAVAVLEACTLLLVVTGDPGGEENNTKCQMNQAVLYSTAKYPVQSNHHFSCFLLLFIQHATLPLFGYIKKT